MKFIRNLALGVMFGIATVSVAEPASAAPPPDRAGCVGQYVTDYLAILGRPIGDAIGHPDGYNRIYHPFGQTISLNAISAHDDCLFDLTP